MREHKILVDGRLHKVKLCKLDTEFSFLIQVDDKTYDVTLADELDCGTRMILDVNGKPCRVEMEIFSRITPFSVKVNGRSYRVQYATSDKSVALNIAPTLPIPLRKPIDKSVVAKGAVAAALPGRVVSLKVKVGDSVEAGDALCVLEAMKMENEVIAPVKGVVKEIVVLEGMIVNKGQALVLLN